MKNNALQLLTHLTRLPGHLTFQLIDDKYDGGQQLTPRWNL